MYDAMLGRFIQRDRYIYVNGLNLYAYVEGRPTAYADPTGRDAWTRKRAGEPTFFNGRSAGYQIKIIHVLPPAPKGATQVWQVVTCRDVFIDNKCKANAETAYTIDIVTIGARKEVEDKLKYKLNTDVCVAIEVCAHLVGFDDQKSNYLQQTNVNVSQEDANDLAAKMAPPKGQFLTFYAYEKKANCKECCGAFRFLIGLFPNGHLLAVDGLGAWSARLK
jgi:hypothetical protein